MEAPKKDAAEQAEIISQPVKPQEKVQSRDETSSIASAGKKKLADHPHWWTIILSIVAIVVSALSYSESHHARLLNEEVNRPLVRITAIDLVGPVLGATYPTEERYPNDYRIVLSNTGRAFANNVKISYKAQVEDMRADRDVLRFSDDKDATIDSREIGDLAPSEEYHLAVWAYVLRNNPTIPLGDHTVKMVSLFIKGNIEYLNPINKAVYKQRFCFIDAGTTGHFEHCSKED